MGHAFLKRHFKLRYSKAMLLVCTYGVWCGGGVSVCVRVANAAAH